MADAAKKEKQKDGEKGKDKPAEKKKSPLKLIIMGAGVFILMLVVAYFLVAKVINPALDKKGEVPKETDTSIGAIHYLNSIIVNLAGTEGKRYLKVTIALEADHSKGLAKELKQREAELVDSLITILSSKDLKDVDSIVGKNRLRREMLDRLNAQLTKGQLLNLYFTEFVVQ